MAAEHSNSRLLALPTELIGMIGAATSPRDLISLHQTCKAISYATSKSFAEKLFTRRQPNFSKRSLDNLRLITADPYLGRFVSSITFDPVVYTEDHFIYEEGCRQNGNIYSKGKFVLGVDYLSKRHVLGNLVQIFRNIQAHGTRIHLSLMPDKSKYAHHDDTTECLNVLFIAAKHAQFEPESLTIAVREEIIRTAGPRGNEYVALTNALRYIHIRTLTFYINDDFNNHTWGTGEARSISTLQDVIRRCISLETLILDVEYEYKKMDLMSSLRDLASRNLTDLRLTNVQSPWINFLVEFLAQQDALQRLTLERIKLEDPEAWIDTFKFIMYELGKLEYFSIVDIMIMDTEDITTPEMVLKNWKQPPMIGRREIQARLTSLIEDCKKEEMLAISGEMSQETDHP